MEDTNFLSDVLVPFLAQLAVLGLGTTAVTDIVKGVQRWIVFMFNKEHWAITGFGSALVALAVALLGVYGYELDLLSIFESVKGFDPELTLALSGLAVWVAGKFIHGAGKKLKE